jgi:hypothetical protein
MRVQVARGIDDDTFRVEDDADVKAILNSITEEEDDDDDRPEPGGLEFSDDEEDPAVARRRREDQWEIEHGFMSPTSRPGLTRANEDWDSGDDIEGCASGLTSVCSGRVSPPVPASPLTHRFMPQDQNEELQIEENGQDDQGSQVPLVSCLMKAAAEIPPELHAQGIRLREEKPDEKRLADIAHEVGALDLSGVLFFDSEPEAELNAAEDIPEYVDVDVAVDSGAGDNVLARVDVPGHKVQESPGSLRGQQFKGAGGHVMANEGQMVLEMLAPTEEGEHNEVDVTWQVADVCRPLLSVSKICDKAEHTVTFDKKRAVVRDAKGRIVCVFTRRGNLYIGRMKVRNPKHPSFGGQGK